MPCNGPTKVLRINPATIIKYENSNAALISGRLFYHLEISIWPAKTSFQLTFADSRQLFRPLWCYDYCQKDFARQNLNLEIFAQVLPCRIFPDSYYHPQERENTCFSQAVFFLKSITPAEKGRGNYEYSLLMNLN